MLHALRFFNCLAGFLCTTSILTPAYADNYSEMSEPIRATQPSSTMMGAMGLNVVPNARSAQDGTIWLGGSFSDPYLHGFMGVQIHDRFSVTLRQSAQISNPREDPDRFLPGVDFKAQLLKEGQIQPALAFGAQSASGHARMGGEYIALSKRYQNFDFTAGLGWGRFASHFKMDNPLRAVSDHFGRDRDHESELAVRPQNWLTGSSIGAFGGVEYFTPWQGLSLKADIGGNSYEAEKSSFSYKEPTDWSVGANFQRTIGRWGRLDSALAFHGLDRISARLTLSQLLSAWPAQAKPSRSITMPQHRPQTQSAAPDAAALSAQRDKIMLTHLKAPVGTHALQAQLVHNPNYTLPAQLGVAALHMAAEADQSVERLDVSAGFLGLKGATLSLLRSDLERAFHGQGSAAELWQSMEISTDHPEGYAFQKRSRHAETYFGIAPFKLILDHHMSLAEEDHGALHRSSVVAKMLLPRKAGYLDYGAALRVNLHDNLHHINDLRPKAILPVRSDIAEFAQDRIALDEAYTAFTHSFGRGVHVAAQSGYLEEMYAGLGGEILYRPFKSRLALGAQSYLALKRDPHSTLHLGLSGDRVLTAQANAYYDLPRSDLTLTSQFGRFLDEDIGAKLGFIKKFHNGVQLSGYVSLSNHSDADLFGGTVHSDHGLRLSLPIGGVKSLPEYIQLNLQSKPFGRDVGQSLNKPLDLYELTTPFSLPHIARHWDDIL